MTAEQQERINAAVKAWVNWIGPETPLQPQKELAEAWRAAQTPKWETFRDAYSSWLRGPPRDGLIMNRGPFTEAEANACCAALNALAEKEAME